jgi:hypothetical protein
MVLTLKSTLRGGFILAFIWPTLDTFLPLFANAILAKLRHTVFDAALAWSGVIAAFARRSTVGALQHEVSMQH